MTLASLARRRAAPGTIERKYPHVVELAIGKYGLDVGLGRRIMHFHNSRHINPRHGHIVLKNGQMYYRWCFSDLARPWPSSNRLAERFTIADVR